MTGAEHYARAESLLADVAYWQPQSETTAAGLTAVAQVHATLALAAATAYPAVKDYCGDESSAPREWDSATSPKRVSA